MRSQYILRSSHYPFILFSILIAFLINIFPSQHRTSYMPDILMLTLLFWIIREPYKINLVICFVFGILMDIRFASLIGEHALLYISICFSGIIMQRRLLNFSFTMQSVHFIPIFAVIYGIFFGVYYLNGTNINLQILCIKPLVEILIFPILANILLLPQKLSREIDHNRPI
jgi:rod shape-determining protein MreD